MNLILTVPKPNSINIAADRKVRKIRQPCTNFVSTIGATKPARIAAEDFTDASAVQNLFELHHDRSKAPLMANERVRAMLRRSVSKFLRVLGVLRQRPLDKCTLPSTNAGQRRLVVHINASCADYQINLRVLSEFLWVAICFCFRRQRKCLDRILSGFNSAVEQGDDLILRAPAL